MAAAGRSGGFWQQAPTTVAGASPTRTEPLTPTSPPVALLGAAASVVAAGFVLWLVGGSDVLALLGWASGSLLTVWLVSRFTIIDARRALEASYSPRPHLRYVRAIVATLGIVVATLNAGDFATSVAKS